MVYFHAERSSFKKSYFKLAARSYRFASLLNSVYTSVYISVSFIDPFLFEFKIKYRRIGWKYSRLELDYAIFRSVGRKAGISATCYIRFWPAQ